MSKKQIDNDEIMKEAILTNKDVLYDISDNWIWTKLGKATTLTSGSGFPKQFQGEKNQDIPFYKVGSLKDIDTNYYINNEDNTVSEETRIQIKAKLIPKDTIIFAKIGEAIKLNRRSILYKPSCIDNNLMGIKGVNALVENKYLLYWTLKEEFYKYTQATAIPSIRKSTMEEIPFPLPPFNEQKRIAEKVERLLGKVDEAKRLIDEAKETFELHRAAILNKAFRGELTKRWREENDKVLDNHVSDFLDKGLGGIPRNWKWTDLETVCKKITDGTHHSPNSYPTGDYKYITAKNIKRHGIILDNVSYVSKEVHQEIYNRCDVEKDDVLYIKDGATTGIATINQLSEEFSLLSSVALLKPNKDILLPKYLMFCLNSPSTKNRMLAMMSGVAITRLTLKKIKHAMIPLPPIDEQEIIISLLEKVEKLNHEIDYYTELEKDISQLKQSILSNAFRGELGTNDPSEESVMELLKEVLMEQVK